MELKQYYSPILKWWWLILASTVVAALASYYTDSQKLPIYQAKSSIVIGQFFNDLDPSSGDIFSFDILSQTYASLADRQVIRDRTMEALNLSFLPPYSAESGEDLPYRLPSEDQAATAGSGKQPAGPVLPVRIDAAGFAARTSALPGLPPGEYRDPAVTAEAVYYVRGDGDASALYRYDLKARKEEKVLDGVERYALSQHGGKLLYRVKNDWFVGEAKAAASRARASSTSGCG